MRILYWVENFSTVIGGIEVLAAHFVTELRARGHQVLIVTSQSDGEPRRLEYEGIPVHRFPFAQVLSRREPQEIARLRRDLGATTLTFRPDVAHLNFNFCGPSAAFYLRALPDFTHPTLATAHVPVGGEMLNVLRTTQRVVAVSASMLGDILRAAPDLGPRASVVPNALAMPKVVASETPSAEPPVLLCVGRVAHEKGFDIGMEAFARLLGKGKAARLIVAGDGAERGQLERRAAELGLGERVSFLGWVPPDRVYELMRGASIVVMPSRWREPFGLVALQAAQVGVACVASAVGGIPEIVQHRETGLLVEPNDPVALAEALDELISDRGVRLSMGRAARERAVRALSMADFARCYEQLYARAIASPSRRRPVADHLPRPRIRRRY